jgi:hypothetical protein
LSVQRRLTCEGRAVRRELGSCWVELERHVEGRCVCFVD